MTRIHAHKEAGSRRSRNKVTMANTMFKKMITVITRVITTDRVDLDHHVGRHEEILGLRSPVKGYFAPRAAKPGLITFSIMASRASKR